MSSSKGTIKIAVIPGDGIGIEVIAAAVKVLKKMQGKGLLQQKVECVDFDYGSARYKAEGAYCPPNFLEALKKFDSILFGAVGDPHVPDHISLWQLLLPMRQHFQQYVNARPSTIFDDVGAPLKHANNPKDLDWVIIRENTEGEYAGQGGRSHIGQPWEVGTELAVFTRIGIERIMEFAFKTAQSRPRKLLTIVTKSNAQRNGMVLWDEVAVEVSKRFPDVKYDKMLVDAMTVRMVNKPQSLDTVVASNLHADILSDLAAALSGSIGIAPSSNLDPTRKCPSLFEPVHGAAFDIMGKDLANPIAAIWSLAELLRWNKETVAADALMEAVKRTLSARQTTGDLGGELGTTGVTNSVLEKL